jgi:Flp pilus assembly protein TadB
MKAETLFNPINLPDLPLAASAPAPVQTPINAKVARRQTAPRSGRRRTSRHGTTRRALDPKRSAIRFARKVSRQARTSWQRVKGGIQARLSHLDREQLKKVLLACGLAAAAVVVIITLVKLTPLIVTLLAVLGLAVVLQFWDRLRQVRLPA